MGKDKKKEVQKNLNAELMLIYGFVLLYRDMFVKGWEIMEWFTIQKHLTNYISHYLH